MPYKTKFREVEFPANGKELKAVGTDANSIRSIGAACYRDMVGRGGDLLRSITFVMDGSQLFIEHISGKEGTRQLRYFAEGIKKGIEKHGAAPETVAYVDRKIAELRGNEAV